MSVSAVEFLQGQTPFWSLKWPLVELQFFSYFWIKLLGFTTVLMKLFTTCKQFLFLCLCEDTITHREVSVTPCVRSFLRLLAVLSVSSRVALAGVQLRTSCSVCVCVCVSRCKWTRPLGVSRRWRELQAAIIYLPRSAVPRPLLTLGALSCATFSDTVSRQLLSEPANCLFSSSIALCGRMHSKWG